jgi:hypothetical protein
MKWIKVLERYALGKKPVLKAVNPRFGTSIIPLNKGDEDLFFLYLQDKVHALYFDGSEAELKDLIHGLQRDQGITVHQMAIMGGKKDKMMFLHMRLGNFQEVQRVIRIQ